MALVVVGAHYTGGVAEAGGGVGQVRQPHHLLCHPVVAIPPHQALRLAVRDHVQLSQLTGRAGMGHGGGVQGLAVGVGLALVCPLLDNRGHPGIRHLEEFGTRIRLDFIFR